MGPTGVKRRIAAAPVVRPVVLWLGRRRSGGSAAYWERRYSRGGTSGEGSYGHFAAWKSQVVNDLVRRHTLTSVVELGCGDGNQARSCEWPRYLGLDVSASAVARAAEIFADDPDKSFARYDPQAFVDRAGWFRADAAVSLEVVFHLVERAVFETYLRTLFSLAERVVVVCSSDSDDVAGGGPHERHRAFTPWVAEHVPGWSLVERVDPPVDLAIASSFFVFVRDPVPG